MRRATLAFMTRKAKHIQALSEAEYVELISRATPAAHADIPAIDLYIGPAAHLYRRALRPLVAPDEKLLTASMVNNYVKQGIIPRAESQALHREPRCHAYRDLPDEAHILDGRHPFAAASFGSDPRHRPRIQLLLRGGRGKPSPALLRRNCPHEPWIV